MSRRFTDSVISAAIQGRREAGVVGSSKTAVQIKQQAGQLAQAIVAAGFANLQSASQLRDKHILAAFEHLREALADRTLQNYARSLRYVLTGADRTQVRDRLTNEVLGIAGASRDGTKTAISDAQLAAFRDAATRLRNPIRAAAMPVVLDLCRHGGLRLNEARMIGAAAHMHLRTLATKNTLELRDGSKGGRFREVLIPEASRAPLQAALERAVVLCAQQGGHIWPAPSGKQAQKSLSDTCRALGMVGKVAPHSLRYAFARDRIAEYQQQGYTGREAARLTSLDLGHGDGRGQYVRQVYLK
jgi:site-specific recombinase XerC